MISSVLSAEWCKLSKAGTHQYKTHCINPAHIDKKPSLHINDNKQIFKCFSCWIYGDVINLLDYIRPDIQHFGEKLKYLNQFIWTDINDYFSLNGQEETPNFQDEKEFRYIMNYISKYWSLQLTKEIKDKYILNSKTISYRAFKWEIITMNWYWLSEEIIKAFKLWFSPNSKELFNDLLTKYDKELIEKTWLFDRRWMPKFKNRIIIPYLDNKDVIYFTARQTEFTPKGEFESAKYLNQSIDNKYYYNESDLNENSIFITEWAFDCLSLKNIWYNSFSLSGLNIDIDSNTIDKLKSLYMAYICFDNDINSAWNKKAEELQKILKNNWINSSIITIPIEEWKNKIDINEYLWTHSKEDFNKLLTY